MLFETIRLQNFRSYSDETFEFASGVNIIVGPNAGGKTNLLEAIAVVGRGQSFKARDIELVKLGQPWARLDGLVGHKRTVKIARTGDNAVKKEFTIDGSPFKRLSTARLLPITLFEPNHLIMLHGHPEARRDYLDGLIAQLETGYTKLLRDYRRTLSQRNALLKQGEHADRQLFAWNIRLSELGGLIASRRHETLTNINEQLPAIYESLAGARQPLKLHYQSDCTSRDYASNMLHLLERRQALDMERGYTTVGPHRDDLILLFGDTVAAEIASRGEVRTVILGLKIIELTLLERVYEQKPIVLLDDVFSELDGRRRRALTEVIRGYQTFITTTDADVVVQHFMEKCHIIPLT